MAQKKESLDWPLIHLDKMKHDHEIHAAISTLMNVSKDMVLISRNNSWALENQLKDYHDVVCEIDYVEGDFPVSIWILPFLRQNPDLKRYAPEYAQELASLLNTNLIVSSDESIDPYDPYIWLLVEPDGRKRLVELDIKLMNKKNVFKIHHFV